jgi:hypothetical protein
MLIERTASVVSSPCRVRSFSVSCCWTISYEAARKSRSTWAKFRSIVARSILQRSRIYLTAPPLRLQSNCTDKKARAGEANPGGPDPRGRGPERAWGCLRSNTGTAQPFREVTAVSQQSECGQRSASLAPRAFSCSTPFINGASYIGTNGGRHRPTTANSIVAVVGASNSSSMRQSSGGKP